MLFPVTYLAVAACIWWVRRSDRPRNGMLLTLYAWVFVLACCAVPLIHYTVAYSLKTDVFVALCISASTVGYLVVRGDKRSVVAPRTELGGSSHLMTFALVMCGMGALGNLMLLAAAVSKGVELSPSFLISNAESLRDDSFAAAQNGVSRLEFFASYLAPCSYLYLALYAYYRSSARPVKVGHRWFALGTFFLVVLVALFYYAGRQSIFVAGLILMIGFWLRSGRTIRLRTVIRGLVAAVVIFYVATSFASVRQQSTDPNILLQQVSHAEFRYDWLNRASASNPQIGQAALQFTYFSGPLVNLDFYMKSGFLKPKTLYGQYSFPFWFRSWAMLSGSHFDWQETRLEVFNPMDRQGFLGNVWATWFRDLYVDFGFFGAVFVASLFGGLMAWARNWFDRTGSVVFHGVEVYVALVMSFGASQSLLYLDFYSEGLNILIAASLVVAAAWSSAPVALRARVTPEPSSS